MPSEINGIKGFRRYDPDVPFEDQDGQPWLVSRPWLSINPIFEADNASLACNVPGSPAPSSIPIVAGESITALYYYWVHTIGPMVLWMADCGGGCEDFDSSEGRWFKIAERGLLSGRLDSGWWFQRDFSQVGFSLLLLCGANKPQFYPECAQLKVTGDGMRSQRRSTMGGFRVFGVWISLHLLYGSRRESTANKVIVKSLRSILTFMLNRKRVSIHIKFQALQFGAVLHQCSSIMILPVQRESLAWKYGRGRPLLFVWRSKFMCPNIDTLTRSQIVEDASPRGQ
ncbi:hypothetical protein B0O99DRAFT_590101 [Bisporella sp. PMI_857]|nr:hypothetical protein B0O99DRAFT_590783 [Bisporella sp. PMI_857]KAH8600430.1 hypothetical protein B0O99DRAFT_590101 [Bisporella sp. PMI_857]